MHHPLRVLIVEDSEDDTLLVIRQLQRSGYTVIVERVETWEAMRTALDRQLWDIVIADYSLPRFSAPNALKLLQQQELDLPFIIVSGSIGEDIAVAAMKAGAHDYLMKENLARLVPAVERELREAEERRQRRRAEQALRESEERFRSLIENALDIITLIDAEGTLCYASPAIERVLGYKPEACVGINVFQHIHPDDVQSVKETLAAAIQEPTESITVEFQFQHQDGSWRVLEAIGKHFPEPTGNPKVVINCRDITERKQIEETQKALQQERELHALKSNFISMVSHEFRTPLSVVVFSAQLLREFGDLASEQKKQEYLDRIQGAAKRMTQLLDEVLFLGKSEAGKVECKPTAFDLKQFCCDLVEELQLVTNSGHPISFRCPYPSLPACMDEFLLQHILTNLLSNAIKYSPQSNSVDFQLTCQDDWAIFQITDQGIGIPEADQERLFDAFHRGSNVGKIPGTGLGLSIVKRSVALHGGNITMSSKAGVGTTFTVRLPLRYQPSINAEDEGMG